MFINIGNKSFVNADKVKFIVGADIEKVRRELAKHNMTRTDKEEHDGTSAKETRSMLIIDDNTGGISSVNATVLAGFTRKNPKTKIEYAKGSRLVSALLFALYLNVIRHFYFSISNILLNTVPT